jgi:hypothetical protein
VEKLVIPIDIASVKNFQFPTKYETEKTITLSKEIEKYF